MFIRFVRGAGAALLLSAATGLLGCASSDPDHWLATMGSTSSLPAAKKPISEGQLQYKEGHYGLAAEAFAKSVEADPLNSTAWLGLAAAYDQIGRFDKADEAYAKVQELVGPTPSVLNNLGYSYLLRGNLDRSRATLIAAQRSDPGNPYIRNNIEMLNSRLSSLGKPTVDTY